MSSILIVEHEGRYIERIQDALSSEGWNPRFVAGRPEALRAAASEEPNLVLINADLPGAPELLRTFARRNGGPGSVALVAEHVGDDEAGRLDADEILAKPFTDQDLRLVVRRGLARREGGRGAAATAATAGDDAEPQKIPADGLLDGDGDMLTSADIFGDVLAEVEAEVDGEEGSGEEGGGAASEAAAEPPDAPAPAAPRAAKAGRDLDDPEIARRLEKTLSGVLGPRKPKPAAAAEAEAAAKKRRARNTDVNELLNLTLSSLDEPPKKKRPRPAGAPFADLDLSEIEALASGVRRKPRPAEPAAEPPPAEGSDPGEASWADVARAVDETPPPGAAAPAPDEVERFGHYALLERIAVGGMAEVWKARMRGVEGFQKTVAIKKILPQMTDNAEFVTMFIDEAKLAAQLNHPNITHIYDLGKIGREHYIAMEFVEGLNLRSVLNQARAKGQPLPIGLALLIGARLASALDYAHRKRDFDGKQLELVHRDVSPQNVLLAYEGDIKLCDFGIVKAVTKASHTQMGALKGKLQYMSPEQAWGQAVDSRSDIFSLGSLLFEMLTGERLFAGDNEISVLDAVRECQIRSPRSLNPAVPEQADAVVLKALAKQPEDRYESAGEMQGELEEILYRLKPTPGQADLADYLRALDAAPALADDQRAEFSWAEASRPPQTAAEAPAADEEIELIFEEEDDGGAAVADDDEEEVVELLEIEGDPAAAGWDVETDAEASGGREAGERAAAASPPPLAGSGGASVLPDDDDDFGTAATQPVPVFEQPPELPPELAEPAGGDPAAPAAKGAEDDEEGEPEIAGIMAALSARGAQGGEPAPDAAVPPPPALPGDRGDDTGTLDRTGERTGERTSVPALAPSQAKVEIEEGGGRSRWMLVAAIVLVIVLGAAAWFLFFRNAAPAPAGEAVEPPVASEPATQPPAGEPEPAADDAAGTEGTATPAAGEAAEATAEEGDAAAAEEGRGGVAYDDLQQIVDQEMAKREAEIRAEQEERVRRLERELRAAQAEAERARAAESEAEGADGGGGDGAP